MAKVTGLFESPCQFGGVGYGETSARLGVTIKSDHMTLTQAKKYLAGSLLKLRLMSFGVQHDDGEQARPAGKKASAEIEATVAVKAFNVKSKSFSFGLTFSTETWNDKQKSSLIKFAKSEGHLLVVESEKIKEQSGISFPTDDEEEAPE